MGNIFGLQGPLDTAFIDAQVALNKSIIGRMAE